MEWQEEEEEVLEKEYDCSICNITSPSTESNPMGLVVLLQVWFFIHASPFLYIFLYSMQIFAFSLLQSLDTEGVATKDRHFR